MNKKTIRDIDVKGKRVLMRVDFNVPLDDNARITDDTRIRAAVPSIEYVIKHGGRPILMSHLGRPKGKVVDSLKMDQVAKRLGQILGNNVIKVNDCIGEEAGKAACSLKDGEVLVLENLRFHKEETKNDEGFAKQLASLGEVFVNDAFGTCHRAHASTEGVTKFLESVSGFLVEKEIEYFTRATQNPAKPYMAILGGAKVSDKIGVIENLMDKVDAILIGGGMAYTFLKAEGIGIGNSKLEADKLDLAKDLLTKAKSKGVKIALPKDNIATDKIEKGSQVREVGREIPDGWMGVDIGPKTTEEFKSILKDAKTIVWNGPVGIFEMEPFAKGTTEIANFIAGLDATTIIGGGDTAAAIVKLGLKDKMSHISTGGGASLEFLEGKTLPGVAALADK